MEVFASSKIYERCEGRRNPQEGGTRVGEPGEGERESPIIYPARGSDFWAKICVHGEQNEQGDKSNSNRKNTAVVMLRKPSSEECKRQGKAGREE